MVTAQLSRCDPGMAHNANGIRYLSLAQVRADCLLLGGPPSLVAACLTNAVA